MPWAALTLVALTATMARAQMPTEAQKEAIRASCRSDYQRLCASVPPGGQASLSCLQRNLPGLSGACQAAVGAVGRPSGPAGSSAAATPPAAPAASAPPAAAGSAARGGRPAVACGADVRTFCRDTPPGGGRILQCLRQNGPSLSPGCRDSLMATSAR